MSHDRSYSRNMTTTFTSAASLGWSSSFGLRNSFPTKTPVRRFSPSATSCWRTLCPSPVKWPAPPSTCANSWPGASPTRMPSSPPRQNFKAPPLSTATRTSRPSRKRSSNKSFSRRRPRLLNLERSDPLAGHSCLSSCGQKLHSPLVREQLVCSPPLAALGPHAPGC